VQCKESGTGLPWNSFGDNFANGASCTPSEGIVCVNRDQPYGTCHDYKVRFNCCAENGSGGHLGGILTFHEHAEKCEMNMEGGKVISTCEVKSPNGRALDAEVSSLKRDVQNIQADVAILKAHAQQNGASFSVKK
jgi:hypothetical protein